VHRAPRWRGARLNVHLFAVLVGALQSVARIRRRASNAHRAHGQKSPTRDRDVKSWRPPPADEDKLQPASNRRIPDVHLCRDSDAAGSRDGRVAENRESSDRQLRAEYVGAE